MKPLILLSMAMLILLIAPACSPIQSAGASSTVNQASTSQAAPDEPLEAAAPDAAAPDAAADIPAPASSSTPEGMVAFEGNLFVATTPPLAQLWQRAGWRIGDQPIDTNAQPAPSDCTLYPHAGVPDQWVGACRGYVLIPEEGAQHIAVIISNSDGSTTLVQVAPSSAGD